LVVFCYNSNYGKHKKSIIGHKSDWKIALGELPGGGQGHAGTAKRPKLRNLLYGGRFACHNNTI